MKKTKLLTIALSVPALAGVTAPLLLLTSCGEKKVNLEVLIQTPEMTNYSYEGDLLTNKSLEVTIECTDGYIIDDELTQITCGDNVFVKGTDYKIINHTKIYIFENKIKSQDLKIDVKAKAALVAASYV